MKTLRTVCLVCAGFYMVQMLGFMFSSYSTAFIRDMMPGNVDVPPLLQAQQGIASLMMAFSPYILIGVIACLLMAWRLKQWWKVVPLLSILLVFAGIIWLLAFMRQMKDFGNLVDGSFADMPEAFSDYLETMILIGYWSSAAPILLPGVLIFIFWWRAQKASPDPSANINRSSGQ